MGSIGWRNLINIIISWESMVIIIVEGKVGLFLMKIYDSWLKVEIFIMLMGFL